MIDIPAADAGENADPEERDEGEPEHAALPVRHDDESGEERA